MTKIIISLFFLLITQLASGQDTAEYERLVAEADSLYYAEDYPHAALTYSRAFQANGGTGYVMQRYKAACSWALAGKVDSAFFNLQRIGDNASYPSADYLTNDPALKSLHTDKRWAKLIAEVNKPQKKFETTSEKRPIEGSNKSLVRLLDSLANEDQKWRLYKMNYQNRELRGDTISLETINRNFLLTDSLNYFQCKAIFEKYGFPNHDLVGEEGASNFSLLVQHQDQHPAFQDSVLAKMKIEVDAKKASAKDYAHLLDRVKVSMDQPQVYGTQMQLNSDASSFEPINVLEPETLNERRKSVGLGTIENYIEIMNQVNRGLLKKDAPLKGRQ